MSPPSRAEGRGSARRRAPLKAIACAIALLGSLACGLAFSAVHADDSPIHIIGTWKPSVLPPGYTGSDYATYTQLFPEPASRHIYSLSTTPGWLVAYDLDSLAPLGGGLTTTGSLTGFATDPGSGDLFLAMANTSLGGLPSDVTLDEYGVRNGHLAHIGGVNLTQQFPGQTIVGMYRGLGTSLLWVVASSSNGTNPLIAELDITNLPAGAPHVDWTKTLSSCPVLMHANPAASAGIGYVPKWNALYFGCGNLNGAITTSPNPRGAARLVLNGNPRNGPTQAPTDFAVYPLPGDFFKAEASFDPSTDRLMIPAYSGPTGATLYVFDTHTNTYVGGISLGNAELIQSGVDVIKGRYYGLATEPKVGLIAADTGPTPIQQGISVPELSHYLGQASRTPAYSNLAVDPLTSRLFLRYTVTSEIVIVKDDLPPYEAPTSLDPDAATSDIEEVAGQTEANYSGGAQGYGARYRMIGGIDAFQFNLVGIHVDQPAVGAGTRELRFSPLDRLTMANDESTALGITAIDDQGNSQGDLGKTQLRNPQTGEAITESPVVDWPYHQVRCVDLGGAPADDVQASENTKVSCNADKSLTSANIANTGGDAGGVTVGPSSVVATSTRDSKLGAVTDVRSTANGISVLGGVLQIGRVEAHAVAQAKGRPGTAKGTYDRTVKDVRLNGQPLCSGNCGDLDALAAQINSQLQGRVRVEFPNPATTAGSPGGYQTVIQRADTEQIEQKMLNEQQADHFEVPGMIIYVYEDGARPGRLITELAAVEAEARYGISATSGGSLDIATGTDVNTSDLADVPTAGDTPVFGVTPPEAFTTKPPRTLIPDNPGGTLNRAGRLIWNGLHGLGRLLPIWAILLAPIYLSARRWLLLQRSTITPGGSA